MLDLRPLFLLLLLLLQLLFLQRRKSSCYFVAKWQQGASWEVPLPSAADSRVGTISGLLQRPQASIGGSSKRYFDVFTTWNRLCA